MTNYIPHYTKKRQILRRKEEALRLLISENAPKSKTVAYSEEIRDARIRVLRAERATIPPTHARERYEEIDARIRVIEESPVAAILAEFGYTMDADVE